MLAIGAGVTVYATHIVNVLRVEVFEPASSIRTGSRTDRRRRHGVAYLAEHQSLNALCSTKLIAPDRAGDPKALARFEREVRTTSRCRRPRPRRCRLRRRRRVGFWPRRRPVAFSGSPATASAG